MHLKFLLIFLSVATFSCVSQESKSKVLSQEEFKKQIIGKSVQLIDVRTEGEFSKGHIKDAKNINLNGDDFKKKITELDKTKAVYVYCQAGGRSASAAKIMSDMGFVKVYDLSGGYSNWEK
jgi:rhodanese-related sulfurtransferase